MNGDLITCKMLTVFRSAGDREMLRQAAALASVPAEIITAESAAAAVSLLSRGGIDLVLVDADLPASEKIAVSKASRTAKERPFLIMIGRDIHGIDVDGSVRKPVTADEAQSSVDSCIRTRIPARVLVVDDSATMRGIVRKILLASKFPLQLSEVDDGARALEDLRKGNFDIVFLDYNMPGLDGLSTLSELRREHPEVTVIMMTSSDSESFAEKAWLAGAAAFLKKPFFPADIDAVLYRFYKLEPPQNA